MDYRFYLDDLEIEEPIGFPDFEISIKRDDKFHGMQFEASTGTLEFYGAAAAYLTDKKGTEGLGANVNFKAEGTCDTEYEEIISGRLNFGRYKKRCGNDCRVSLPVEEQSCKVVFTSRFDQKVDIDSLTAFDGLTVLPAYTNMGQEIELPAKALFVSSHGKVADAGDTMNVELGGVVYIRPTYTALDASILTSQLDQPFTVYEAELLSGEPITPQLLFEDLSTCFPGTFTYNHRIKGSYNNPSVNGVLFHVKVKHIKWDAVGDIFADGTIIDETVVFQGPPNDPAPFSGTFDVTHSGTMPLEEGVGIYHVIEFGVAITANPAFVDVTFDPETQFLISATRLCPNTFTKSYLVHETLSRVAEAITDRCIRVKSEYYGRIDSQPFAFDADGCGGLRMLTSGLKIRRAPEDKFFASMKDLIEGLNGIDNIGFSIEPDPEFPNGYILRVEPVQEFYIDEEILRHDNIPIGDEDIQEAMHWSKILAGYRKWKVERVNGLGEPNSTREYRTSLETISNTLDIQSDLVTGSYPIEITRQQSFALTGAADTAYDNDIFLICLIRNAYDFAVEQGNIDNPANIFDPDTLLNFRITPVRNLMRWYKSIINSYPNLSSSLSKLIFSAGTGNLTAEGELMEGAYDAICKLENMVIRENQDLFITHFARQEDALPLWKPETMTYEYPMSVGDYKKIKEQPYGFIAYQCGSNAPFEKGFIKEVKYRPAKGKATFILKKKWE